jgi:endonuclease YncB( thermonuclease family)
MNKQKIVLTGIIGCIFILIVMVVFYPSVPVLLASPNQAQNVGCKGHAGCFSGQVTRVIDGDTVVVNDVHVRFALASAPELTENGGIEAKSFIESLCTIGSRALVDEDDGQTGGSYGRTVAELYCDNQLVNSALLEKNLGTIDKRFCGVSEFSMEDWAKKYGC